MAETTLKGYLQAVKDHESRIAEGLSWNSEIMKYEKRSGKARDPFMEARIKAIKDEAVRYFPSLLPAFLFAPNTKSRFKTLSVLKFYIKTFGKPGWADILKSLALTASSFTEFIRIIMSRIKGHEGIIRQPKVNRVDYSGNMAVAVHDIAA